MNISYRYRKVFKGNWFFLWIYVDMAKHTFMSSMNFEPFLYVCTQWQPFLYWIIDSNRNIYIKDLIITIAVSWKKNLSCRHYRQVHI